MKRPIHFFAWSVLLLTLFACGGGGGGSTVSIDITASASQVTYGQPVTISWTSHNVRSIAGANFAVSSAATSGNFSDYPATIATYTITGEAADGSRVSDSVTVSIKKGAKRILAIADPSSAGTNQVVQYLQGLTTQTVTLLPNLPGGFSADVVVIGNSAAVGPADRSKLTNFMATGGGVVLVRRAPCLLATGDANNNDISAIASFFAGATSCTVDIGVQNVVSGIPVGFPLGATLRGDRLDSGMQVGPVTAQATKLSVAATGNYQAFAYKPASGGRIAYVADAPIDGSPEGTAMRNLFLAAVRWASKEGP